MVNEIAEAIEELDELQHSFAKCVYDDATYLLKKIEALEAMIVSCIPRDTEDLDPESQRTAEALSMVLVRVVHAKNYYLQTKLRAEADMVEVRQ